MMIRSSRQRPAAETGKTLRVQVRCDEPDPRVVGVVEVEVGHRVDSGRQPGERDPRGASGLDDEGRIHTGDQVVAATEATTAEFGPGESRCRLGIVEAQQLDGQQAPRARV